MSAERSISLTLDQLATRFELNEERDAAAVDLLPDGDPSRRWHLGSACAWEEAAYALRNAAKGGGR